MVLLDDSNSYWWLVRVVKDGSIGYLPAEHIETPTERLARLNKHRNVDLSATMLGDNSEKSKNPLKKAMRRRNAKTVNFAPPTYIEASDVEYSTDEEDEHGDFFNDDETVESEDGEAQEQNEDIVVEPLRTKAQKEKLTERAEGTQSPEKQEPERSISEPRRSSEEFFDPEGKIAKPTQVLHRGRCNLMPKSKQQNLLLVDPETALYAIRILSSRTIPPNRRRYPSRRTCCVTNPAAPL